MQTGKYIQVIVPLKLAWVPLYSVDVDVHRGDRVFVTVNGRQYCGVVYKVDVSPDIDPSKIIPIDGVPVLAPVTEEEIKLWEFISSYYMCTIGEVYKCAYPVMKVHAELAAQAARERAAAARARQLAACTASLEARLGRLEYRISKHEEAIAKRQNSKRASVEFTQKLIDELAALREEAALVRDNAAKMQRQAADAAAVFAAVASPASVQPSALPEVCKQAVSESADARPLFLHSSERASRYIQEARAQLEAGRSTLILVPEVAIGDTMQEALKTEFGDRLRIFNFQYSQVQRRKVMDDVRDTTMPEVILGTKSSLFLPFKDLGLVIVDEEQDPSFKQTEPAPRFNTRDVGIVLARIHGARIILGSECPSLETLENCLCGKYMLEEGPLNPACVEVVDLSAERHKRGVRDGLSYKLIDAIRETSGTVRLIRVWEQPETLAASLASLFPDRQIQILTASEARLIRQPADLTAVLQADAFFCRPESETRIDFRADERALQTFSSFRTRRLLIQTTRAEHPVFSILASHALPTQLLEERRAFNLPPFTREVQAPGQSFFFPKDSTLAARKADLQRRYPSDTVFDVDPR